MGDGDRVVVHAPRAQVVGQLLRIDSVAPAGVEAVDLQPDALGDGGEALRERAAGRHQHALLGRVQQRRLHHRRPAAGGDEDVVRRAEQRPQIGRDAQEQFAELRAAMADHGAGHLLEEVGSYPSGAGDEVFANHEVRGSTFEVRRKKR